MKIKTSELSGVQLDWEVARLVVGYSYDQLREYHRNSFFHSYSTDWSLGGPIIERERILLEPQSDHWEATRDDGDYVFWKFGKTPLIAAMRCYVASKLGAEVEVPDELTP